MNFLQRKYIKLLLVLNIIFIFSLVGSGLERFPNIVRQYMILTPEEYGQLSQAEQAGCRQVSVPVITSTVSAVQAVSSSYYDRGIYSQSYSQNKFPSPVLRSWSYTSTPTSTVAAVAETKIATYTSVESAYYTSTSLATSTTEAVQTYVPSTVYTVVSTAYQTTVATETTTESPTYTLAAVVSTVSPTFTVAAVYTAVYSTMYEVSNIIMKEVKVLTLHSAKFPLAFQQRNSSPLVMESLVLAKLFLASLLSSLQPMVPPRLKTQKTVVEATVQHQV